MRDGVDVAGQVQVEVLHGDDLGVAAAGGTALDAEDRAQRGLPDAGDDVLADVLERLTEADGRDRLALSQGRRVDGGHVDVATLRPVLELVEDVERDLGLVAAVELEVLLGDPDLRGHIHDGTQRRLLSDLQVRLHPGPPSVRERRAACGSRRSAAGNCAFSGSCNHRGIVRGSLQPPRRAVPPARLTARDGPARRRNGGFCCLLAARLACRAADGHDGTVGPVVGRAIRPGYT